MKTTRLLIFTIFILFVLNVNVYPLFAQAPTTPKILFTSTRDGGQREVYIMNTDGMGGTLVEIGSIQNMPCRSHHNRTC